MTILKRVTMAVIAGTLSAGIASAQIKEQQPAEFPPASYKGKQYVDSKGCVFIRAGIDGDVSWVPRVTRSRKTICGFTPSLAGQQVASATAKPAPKKVEQITVDAPAAKPVAAAKPKPVKRAAAKPKPRRAPAAKKVVRQTAPKPLPQVAPKPVVVAKAPAPKPAAPVRKRTTRRVATACPGASALSRQYLRGDGRGSVRCGPQAEPIVGFNNTRTRARKALPQVAAPAPAAAAPTSRVVAAAPNGPITVSPNRRIVPRHVAINRINTRNLTIPRGYKRAWNDDRLNPNRAEQTLAGRQQMLLIWTNTVPRRLLNRHTGEDVTATVPLVYPYIDQATQQRELGEVTIVRRNGQVLKRILRNIGVQPRTRQPVYSTRSAPRPTTAAPTQPASQPALKPRVAAPKPAAPAVGGKRYVQIGYFSTRAKADKAAGHLAGMGMRARIGKVRKGGKSYLAVQAGPFNSPDATQSALSRLRGIGYTGAVARK